MSTEGDAGAPDTSVHMKGVPAPLLLSMFRDCNSTHTKQKDPIPSCSGNRSICNVLFLEATSLLPAERGMRSCRPEHQISH